MMSFGEYKTMEMMKVKHRESSVLTSNMIRTESTAVVFLSEYDKVIIA